MIKLQNIGIYFGERVILKNAEMLVRNGDRIGLVGPNGAGKSTVIKVLAGLETPSEGEILKDPGLVIGYFSQDTGEMREGSVLENVIKGAGRVYEIGLRLSELEERMCSSDNPLSDREMDEYGELQTEFLARDGYDLENRAREILMGLGFEEERLAECVENFSGGWKMRIALARILALCPDVLLLDEPTNHLDIESIVWLEEWLRNFPGDLVLISHDRKFMTDLCKVTVEVANGRMTTYSGNYDFYLREREIRRAQLIATYERQQAQIAKDEEFIARFAARASHANLVQSRIKMLEKLERVALPPEEKVMSIMFHPCPRSGEQVVVLDNIGKSYGQKTVLSGISGVVRRLDKIALTGVNGAGKSTLLKIITDYEKADCGTSVVGASVRLGYFSQYSYESLDPEMTIFEQMQARVPEATTGEIMSMLGAFLFSGDDTKKKISVLSGGEKSRVALCAILARPVNFLVLDEPTNHLDILSREVLLKALKDFDGTILIVSHDRYFLHQIANRVFEIDHGKLNIYEGDYSYYTQKTGRGEIW